MKPLFRPILRVFLTVAFSVPATGAILEPSDLEIYDLFGGASSISGNNVLVASAQSSPDNISYAGAAYIFRGVDTATGKIMENSKLLASDRDFGSGFGASVTLSGTTGLVGSYSANNGQGTAYLFRNLDAATGTVTEHAKLVSSTGQKNTYFGISSSISGDNALVGAMEAAGQTNFSGAAFLYRNIGTATGTVVEDLTLTASDGSNSDYFGYSVSLSGSTALVGAMADHAGDGLNRGSAYVFRDLDTATGTITENAKLVASDSAAEDYFGGSVYLEGTTGYVSVRGHDNGTTADQGAVYIFRNLDTVTGTVTENAKLTASDGKFNDGFGGKVSVSGDNALVLTDFLYGGDPSILNTSVYVFTGLHAVTGEANETLKLSVSGVPFEPLVASIGLSGDNFVIGYGWGGNDFAEKGRAFTGSLSTMLTLDGSKTVRATDGISFASRTDWIIGQKTSGNHVVLSEGDHAGVTGSGRGVYIGESAGSNSNSLTIAGTLTTNQVHIGATSGSNSGNVLRIVGGGVLETGLISADWGTAADNFLVIDGGTIRFTRSGDLMTHFQPGEIVIGEGGLTIDNPNNRNFISAVIGGEGGLTKTSNGVLELSGANTYQGDTILKEGQLVLNNTSGSATGTGNVHVMAGTLLGGAGGIAGDLVNRGTVAPGNSPGTIHVGGDFQQKKNGTLQMEIFSTSLHDVLSVAGKVRLGGTLRLHNAVEYLVGQRFNLIEAGKGITGSFAHIALSTAEVRARFIVSGDSGVLAIAPKAYSQMATTPNEMAVAAVLDGWINGTDKDTSIVSENLDLLSPEQYRVIFNQLSPSLFAAGLATSIEQSQGQMMTLNQHLNSRRLRPGMPDDAAKPWEAWAISTGAYSPGSMSSLAGEDYSAGNFIAGIERQVVPGVTAGLFNSYGDSEGDFAGSSEIEEERFTLGAHATAQYGGSYANTALGFGILEMDVKRSINFGNLSRKARSSTDGTEFFAMLSGGHDFRHGSWIFGPSAALQYSKVRYDDVKESGAGALDLVVSNPEDDSLRSQIGGRVAYLHKANERLTLVPEARIFWQHEFLRDNETLDAALEQGMGLGFQHQVADSDGDSVFTGVGLGFQTDFGFYGNVSYDLEFGREGDVNQTLSVGADWKF